MASALMVFCSDVCCVSPIPMATVNSRASAAPAPFNPTDEDLSVGTPPFAAHERFSSPITARLPLVAEPNSQSIWKLSFKSRQPSLEPTNPQLTRVKPQLAPMASDHSFF